jgi:hypothetical protein
MSLAIVFKGPEGIVLAADSRVTLTAQVPQNNMLLPVFYDNATKLLRVNGQSYVGAVTYGAGAIGEQEPRTAHSFIPEFEEKLKEELNKKKGETEEDVQLSVEEFADRLSEFFAGQWKDRMPQNYSGPDMVFLIGGYDKGQPYGRVFEVAIPSKPKPREQMASNAFGLTWGGQKEFVDRLIQGYDAGILSIVQQTLQLPDAQRDSLGEALRRHLAVPIPYQFLPLQDCVDLAIFLLRTTIALQKWIIGVRGVGGAIDVATITRTEGFRPIQQKEIRGEQL